MFLNSDCSLWNKSALAFIWIFSLFNLDDLNAEYATSAVQTDVPLPGVPEGILGCTRIHLTSMKTKHRNRLNLETAFILPIGKIRPRI
jgi:hypothetical protein